MGDVRKLREAVEQGTLCQGDFISAEDCELIYAVFPLSEDNNNAEYVGMAMDGSLDAAKALHEALLPGWDWTMHGNGQAAIWPPGSVDEQNSGCIEADVEGLPSRALLLAILRALEGGGADG